MKESIKMSKKVRFGIVVFPGSNCDSDCFHVIQNVLKQEAVYLWHKDTDLQNVDAVVLPGGFSYGDYLRCGAIAHCSPIMESIKTFVAQGGLVLGICNGFQVLLESGLLPGAMKHNTSRKFICKYVDLVVNYNETPFTNQYQVGETIRIPIAHNEGNYHPVPGQESLAESKRLFAYADNPNGAYADIAGLTNEQGNVLGMMPHPERCSEADLLGEDGFKIFQSMVVHLQRVAV